MNKRSTVFLLTTLFLTAGSVFALDIPLAGGGSSSSSAVKIGFVDMDRIFKIYPQTQAAKEDYAKQLKKKREQLATKEKELEDIKNRIGILESTLANTPEEAPMPVEGEEPAPPRKSVPTLKKELDDARAEYEEMKKQASQDLSSFQSQQSQIILGKIYQALRDLALEEQVIVVVDKASILYGDATIDLTDRLQERVRGY